MQSTEGPRSKRSVRQRLVKKKKTFKFRNKISQNTHKLGPPYTTQDMHDKQNLALKDSFAGLNYTWLGCYKILLRIEQTGIKAKIKRNLV